MMKLLLVQIMRLSLNFLNRVASRVLPKVQIHTWGGFGSQLYGVYLYFELEKRLPFRRLQIVVHTSGVTERFSEIAKYTNINSVQISDFNSYDRLADGLPNVGSSLTKSKIRKTFRKIALAIGVMSESNVTCELESIRPWILSTRGHYTNLVLDRFLTEKIYCLIQENSITGIQQNQVVGIQYRLGDLVGLENKFPTKPEAIDSCLKKIGNQDIKQILVHSDSLSLAVDLLRPFVPSGISLEGVPVTAEESIILLSNCSHFIGTTAKISVWVAIFRKLLLEKDNTFMQLSFEKQLKGHGITDGINFY
jgi:hypothetical protein